MSIKTEPKGNHNGHYSSKKYKKVPPEGGFGYFVAVGLAISFVVALGVMPSFGLMFGDFLTDLGEETSALALITSSFFSALSFAGLLTNTLIKKTSCRTVGLLGGFLYFTGSLMTVFVSTIGQLLFTFSLFQGAGFGFIIPVAYTTFNSYFVERRVFVMSIAQTLIGFGSMVYPIIIQKLMDLYGFRGCMAVMAAINGHAILGMLVMHPVSWHLKKVLVSDEYEIVPLQSPDEINDDINKKPYRDTVHPVIPQQSLSLKRSDSISNRRTSSIKELSNLTEICSQQSRTKWQIVVDFLDLTLLKNPVYVNIVVGISLAHYSDVAFFTFQPMYLFLLGYTKSETAYIISIGAAADLLSRIFLAASSACIKVKARYVYLAGALFTVVSRFAFLCVFDFTGMAVITAVMGFLRTWIHVPLPLIFAEILTQERFPSGYGLFMFLQGNIMFIIGPVIGYLRDITGSYTIAFHSLAFVMAAGCVIPWFYEICYYKFYKKKEAPVVE